MVTVKGNIAEFRFYRPAAQEVYLAGDFNDWRTRQLRMSRTESGYWVAKVRLPSGTFKFRYYADGQWFADYAAFGIEHGPFGFDGVVRIPRGQTVSLHLADSDAPAARAQTVGA